jgi:peptide/nickel transport system substrate-binding protein
VGKVAAVARAAPVAPEAVGAGRKVVRRPADRAADSDRADSAAPARTPGPLFFSRLARGAIDRRRSPSHAGGAMSWLRLSVLAPPSLLAGLMLASFATVKMGRSQPARNEITVAIAGEPDTLHPALLTTRVAADVARLVFSGLIRLDEHLEPVPELAESWEQRQVSTVFLRSPEVAVAAAQTLESLRARWPAWKLTRTETEGDALRLHLAEPGVRSSREIVSLLDAASIQRLRTVRTSEPFPESPAIRRLWRDGPRATEATFTGEDGPGGETVAEHTHLDEPELVFHLRQGVRWHDGAPFTAEDVAFTFRAITDDAVASPRRSDFQLVQAVEVPGPRTVRVVYRRPYASALFSWGIGMLPRHLLEGLPRSAWAAGFGRAPVGTGPFRFEAWKTNEQVTVARNRDWFRGAPALDRVVFRIIPDLLTTRIAFRTGQIDAWEVDPHSAARVERGGDAEVLSAPALEYQWIGWNLRRPHLAERTVRLALAHAIDTDALIRHAIGGRGVRATGPFVPANWFFDPGVEPIAFDPARARALLAEAGWHAGPDGVLRRHGEPFRLELATSNVETRKDIATLVQADLRRIGIAVEVRVFEWATFIAQVIQPRAFDGVVLGWSLRPDPDQFQVWHSSQTGPRQLNIVGYANARADELLDALRTEYDRGEVRRLAADFQRTIYDDQPYAFLYVPVTGWALRRGAFQMQLPGEAREGPPRAMPGGIAFEFLRRAGHAAGP